MAIDALEVEMSVEEQVLELVDSFGRPAPLEELHFMVDQDEDAERFTALGARPRLKRLVQALGSLVDDNLVKVSDQGYEAL
jgi:hypothetical protein